MGGFESNDKKGKLAPRLAGAACAGALEISLFHPIDTIAKRLMNNKNNAAAINDVIFQKHAGSAPMQRFQSLFPGIGYGAAYKLSQRVYKFGGQPYVREYMRNNHGSRFDSVFGSKFGKVVTNGFAGSVMGIGEVVLLPLDALKIKAQTNPEFGASGVVKTVQQEGMGLYRGWGFTIARNAPGSFALFGTNALVREYVFGLTDGKKATFLQTSLSSCAGSVASILVACPLDVVKTRLQSGAFGEDRGMKIIGDIIKNEGFGAFFKGSVPKVLTVGPKLVFSFTIAQYLMQIFEGSSSVKVSVPSPRATPTPAAA